MSLNTLLPNLVPFWCFLARRLSLFKTISLFRKTETKLDAILFYSEMDNAEHSETEDPIRLRKITQFNSELCIDAFWIS